MRGEYDIIVVGAGPGGSIAARTAAEECDVLLIEKRQEIGSPVRCAEFIEEWSLSPYIQPNKKWIATKVDGARFIAPDGTAVERSRAAQGIEGVLGYVLERKSSIENWRKKPRGQERTSWCVPVQQGSL